MLRPSHKTKTKNQCSEEHISTKEQLAVATAKRSSRRREISNSSNLLEYHNLCAHHPKHPDCPVCNASKVQREQCRKSAAKSKESKNEALKVPKPTAHGQHLIIDHIILEKEEDLSRNGDRVAAILLDLYSKWLEGHAAKTNSADTTQAAINRFLGPSVAPDYVYSDNSKEIKKAMENLSWADRHDTSTPNRPQTNGTIERVVRKVKEGIRALLLQAGANPEWWADAMRR